MSAEQQEEILEIFKKHRWPRICRRLNIVSPEYRQTHSEETIRKTLIECKSQSFSINNKAMRSIYERILEMLPPDFERGPNLCFTNNHNDNTTHDAFNLLNKRAAYNAAGYSCFITT
jgi:Holliday junction resolvasome RuvABC ATP-dependent DNA helicase subunit